MPGALGIFMLATFLYIGLSTLKWTATAAKAQSIPPNPMSPCAVPATMFASWFDSGTPATNGLVDPADSLAFPNAPNCSFYQWSKQMFLWLTSPAPASYGGGSMVFDSPVFFEVSPPDVNGIRTFIQHTPGNFATAALSAAKAGPTGFPIVFDKTGRMLEVHPAKLSSRGKPLVLDANGRHVEVERITVQNGKAVFVGQNNKPIPGARPILPQQKTSTPKSATAFSSQVLNIVPVQKFMIAGQPLLITSSGAVIETEVGQADDGVLLSQNSSLVYYITMVNDVYAYFLTGTKDGAIPPPGGMVSNAQFPTTASDLSQIVSFATANGITIPDPNALAIEIKSSWVLASSVPSSANYITITATVPTYDTSNPTTWVQNGQQTVQLALVGMHVVGSTAGHPEMLWATFEHFGNAPNAAYQYVAPAGVQNVPQNTAGAWLFTVNGSLGPFNCSNQSLLGANIAAVSGGCATGVVTPNNVIRWKSFGAAFNQPPNPIDPSTAASNSEIISIHNTTQVPGADVRNQYFMTGTTWTDTGAAPTGMWPAGNEVGTSRLSNTSMETFAQGTSNMVTGSDTNCFTCHVSNTVTISHVFCDPVHGCTAGIQPLF